MRIASVACPRLGLDLRIRSWGDEHVVWDLGSGDTHLLTTDAVELLRSLAGDVIDRSTSRCQVAVPVMPGPDGGSSRAEREHLVAELARIGLIEIGTR